MFLMNNLDSTLFFETGVGVRVAGALRFELRVRAILSHNTKHITRYLMCDFLQSSLAVRLSNEVSSQLGALLLLFRT